MVISLGCRLLDTSSGLPEGSAGSVNAFYLTLLRAGFALPSLLPATRCALTTPFHPCLSAAREFMKFMSSRVHERHDLYDPLNL